MQPSARPTHLILLALLTARSRSRSFDWEDESGRPTANPGTHCWPPSAATRSHGVVLLCGTYAIPSGHKLFLQLSRRLVFGKPCPKISEGISSLSVVFRYTAPRPAGSLSVLCLSRNLTFDRSWDTALGWKARFKIENVPIREIVRSASFSALPKLVLRLRAERQANDPAHPPRFSRWI